MSAPSHNDLGDLVRQAQGGSAEAAEELFARYRGPLLAVIRRGLSQLLRRLCDSDDFLADTFMEIFTGKFEEEILSSPKRLWPYLRSIAENKVRDERRKRLKTQRFAIKDDISMATMQDEEALGVARIEISTLQQLAEEELDDFVEALPLVSKRVVQMLLLGHTVISICAILKPLRPKDIYRIINRLKSWPFPAPR